MSVEKADIVYEGYLSLNSVQFNVQAVYASRSSLFVRVENSSRIRKGTEFDDFSLKLKGEELKLGRCRYFPVHDVPNFEGRLIFTENVYDFYSIVRYGRLSDAQNYFKSLYLFLQQREKIRPEFREYIANLSFDLNVYKKFFDDIDFKYRDEPDDVLEEIRRTIIETEGDRYKTFFGEKLHDLEKLVSDYSTEEHEYHGYYLRRQLWNIISSSEFLSRTNIRPRGYAGDSEMMRMVYENRHSGQSIFSRLMHKHPIETQAAQAVRNRKILVPEYIYKTEKEMRLSNKEFTLLSVACGPASELENIIQTREISNRYHFTLLDQDSDALDEAAQNISSIESRIQGTVKHRYIFESVRTMMGIRNLKKQWGQFHFIYSMGLFDYLNDKVAKAVLGRLYELLRKGGVMLIGNYHTETKTKIYMDYWMDWPLNYRTEKDFLELASDLPNAELEVFFEETNSQMFLRVKKKK